MDRDSKAAFMGRLGVQAARRDLFTALVTPSSALVSLADRRRAEMLAGLLLTLLSLGLLSGLVQLAMVPNFLGTFIAMSAALVLLGLAYLMSRTQLYRLAATIACIAPVGACVAVAINNPADRIAGSFMILGTLFASMFLSTRAAAVVAAGVLAAIATEIALVPALRTPDQYVPLLAFHAIAGPLLLLSARQRNRIEAEQEARMRDADALLRLTEEARAELAEKVTAENRLSVVGRLTAGLGHDLNNLLMAMMGGHLQLAASPPDATLLRAQMEKAGATATKLIRQMLTLARTADEAPRRTVLDLNTLLTDITEILHCAVGRRCRLDLHPHGHPVLVRADALDLQRILLNLAFNAADAMPDGGALTIRIVPRVRVSDAADLAGPAARAAIVVTDTGHGMDARVRAEVLRPFVTTRAASGNVGLGLAIVDELIRRQGGLLELESEPDRGSRFTIALPLAAPVATDRA
jgi:signal transduction histidine kinase